VKFRTEASVACVVRFHKAGIGEKPEEAAAGAAGLFLGSCEIVLPSCLGVEWRGRWCNKMARKQERKHGGCLPCAFFRVLRRNDAHVRGRPEESRRTTEGTRGVTSQRVQDEVQQQQQEQRRGLEKEVLGARRRSRLQAISSLRWNGSWLRSPQSVGSNPNSGESHTSSTQEELPENQCSRENEEPMVEECKDGCEPELQLELPDDKTEELKPCRMSREKSDKNNKLTRFSEMFGAQIGEYKCLRLIGKGSFGKVFLATDPFGDPVAVKVLPKAKITSRRKQRLVADEKRVMIECGEHPFVMGLQQSFQTREHLCFVTEFCSGGELFFHLDRAGRFSEKLVRFYASEITLALSHLHKRGIAFRDLKSENLLLNNLGHIVLTDFGLAHPNVTEFRGARSVCGTPAYISPEMIKQGGKGKAGYGYSVDYWGLGTLIYDMLIGQPPFLHSNMEVMCEQILTGRLTFPPTAKISYSAKDLIRQLLTRNPGLRLGSSNQGGLAGIAHHDFFAHVEWNELVSRSALPAPIIITLNGTDIADKEDGKHDLSKCFNVVNFHKDFTDSSVEASLAKKSTHGKPSRRENAPTAAEMETFLSSWNYLAPSVLRRTNFPFVSLT